jgi:hypothetical protein
MGSILLPWLSGVRLYLSGDRNLLIASSQESTSTLARLANPGMLAHTLPFLSLIASIVIQTNLTASGSVQIVDSVIEVKSFVKVMLTRSTVEKHFYM